MNVKTMYIPKPKKAREVAKVLRIRTAEVRGKYLSQIVGPPGEPVLTPQRAAEIAYILEPESAAIEEQETIARAQEATDNPAAFGLTQHQANRKLEQVLQGWWALGIS